MKSVFLKSWVIRLLAFLAIILACLMAIDQWQGGPLGRTYRNSGNEEGITNYVGQRIWFGGDVMTNSTWIPYQILSVRPVNTPAGLTIKAGVMRNTSLGGIIYLNTPLANDYKFIDVPVSIPPHETLNSKNRYVISLTISPIKPGSYQINGLLITYRWGPFRYTAKNSMVFSVTAKGN